MDFIRTIEALNVARSQSELAALADVEASLLFFIAARKDGTDCRPTDLTRSTRFGSHMTVYRGLKSLTQKGYLLPVVEGDRRERYYSLTRKAREEIACLQAQFAAALNS
jgi:DNA-binding MarR family transcriptional regulator